MAPKKSPSIFRTALILVLLFSCLGVIAILSLVELLPGQAARDFGPADRGLDPIQKALYSARLLMQKDDLLLPASTSSTQISFQIQNGESVNLIALHLENAGLIRDAAAFRYYLIYSGIDMNLQSGDFSLSPTSNAVEIAKTLQDANAKQVTFRILAGWRLEEVAAGLAVSGLSIKADDFIRQATAPDRNLLPKSLADLTSLEGYLAPGVYQFRRSAKITDVVAAATKQFDDQLNSDLLQGFYRQGLTLNQAVILASIVQREAMVADEQPTIASVFFNRIKKGMKLDSDPTVQYALGYDSAKKTWWKNPLSLNDLKIDSPYNTYNHTGFPPAPIDSPGLSALRAVAFPAQTPYFYFRAKCDNSGLHNFSATFDEHLGNACP
jgi:UPF0755 protein